MSEPIAPRLGMTATRGRLPHRWWCALVGHRWRNHRVSYQLLIARNWKRIEDPNPLRRCDLCTRQEPWSSEPFAPATTVDFDNFLLEPEPGKRTVL